ncbi:hypothetical protein [Haematobacter genomosp. 1]|uniref:Uncharacterized protein n=1 Tax=Haematobacter genomosp. 1 TaxID=366618 RepID=A0A212A711_9RHOB|nr:hypothetical protein [Haematobacter genomosp. 1]OWJ75031.1 hypothetical protein CDV49_18080 [Haematobacter genomosp. 1]
MLHQYNPQRFTMREVGGIVRKIGTIPVGSIIRMHPSGTKVRVEAWLPRDYATYRRGVFRTTRIVGGHLALVRRLRDNEVFPLSDCHLLDAPEA